MNFSVEFYETAAGACPVREFLDELKASDPDDFAAVVAGPDCRGARHSQQRPGHSGSRYSYRTGTDA